MTGVDVAAVERIAQVVERRPRFLSRLFTPAEVEYCAGRPERLAARWAAKEAVRKVHGSLGLPLPPYAQVSVRHRPGGAPEALVRGEPVPGLELSLSHDAGLAIAVAVLSGIRQPLPLPAGVRLPERPPDGHKGTFGTVTVIGGSPQFPGAAALAARGALRGGAGKVRCIVSSEGRASELPAEVIRVPASESDGTYSAADVRQVVAGLAARESVACGPGLGSSGPVEELLEAVLEERRGGGGLVLDADALNGISRWRRLGDRVPRGAILTPHPLEAARLLGVGAEEIQADRPGAARRLARRWDVVVVLKGANSVVAGTDPELWTDPHATSALAIGGSGDVLSGLIAALLAQGLAPGDAARAGVFLHGEAGQQLAASRGRAGLLASEVADQLVEVQEEARCWQEAAAVR